jgi:hypothetical protein
MLKLRMKGKYFKSWKAMQAGSKIKNPRLFIQGLHVDRQGFEP